MDVVDRKHLYSQVEKYITNARDQLAVADFESRDIDESNGLELLDRDTNNLFSVNDLRDRVTSRLQAAIMYSARLIIRMDGEMKADIETALEAEGVVPSELYASIDNIRSLAQVALVALAPAISRDEIIDALKSVKDNRPRLTLIRRPWSD